jgi:putative ABC transport system permease protein
MIKNYLLIAWRHLTRHKLFSVINIFCLSIGITFAMLIGVYILKQKSVNSTIRNVDRQYVIRSKWKVKEMGLPITTIGPLPGALKKNYPQLVANFYRFNPVTNVVSAGDKHFKENIAICDTNLVSMYGFELLHGHKDRAFLNNGSAVITEALANKLYGTTDVLNKTVSISNTTSGRQDYIISAVLKDMPYNTVNNYIDPEGYSLFVPFAGNLFFGNQSYNEDWNNIYIPALIELQPGVEPKDLARPMAALLSLNLPANLKGLLEPELVPIKEYYLKDNNAAVRKMITVLTLVGVFILLMAVINFINISIGTSSYRLKEIGLRKVFGSAKRQLVFQYLAESLVLVFLALLISLGLYELARPGFSDILKTRLDPVWKFDFLKIGFLVLLAFSVGLIAGIYPAFVLSSSNILHSIKGKIDAAGGGMMLRKTLLIVQFTLATFIFISALNVSRQVSYFFNKELGYDKEKLLVITAFPKQWDSLGVKRMETIRNGLMDLPEVRSASMTFEIPDRRPPATIDLLPGTAGNSSIAVVPLVATDENFAATFGLKIKEGSFFNNYRTSEEANGEIILNEAAVKAMGWQSALNKTVSTPQGSAFRVTGVVGDFHFLSLQENVGPLAFVHVRANKAYRYLSVKIQSADMAKAVAAIKNKWTELSPGSPFDYSFMDDKFANLYRPELQLRKAANMATVLNLLIVFMGVFGIVAFTLARRVKEIAVRKVLGADVKNILFLFFRDYGILMVIASIIAWPLVYLATDRWLQNYANRVHQDVVPYLVVTGTLFLTAFIFIALQCYKAAAGNPVKSLRAE